MSLDYKPTDDSVWQGRIDSESNFDAFRWHQWIKNINLNSEDIPSFKGKLGFAFIGFCCDEGIRRNKGRVGAAAAPESIRKKLANLPCSFTKEVELFDTGNIYCENLSLEDSEKALSKAVEKILSLNLFPIVLGGGHETTFGNYNGVFNFLSKENSKPRIGIINFDAHFDLRPYEDGINSGTMFRQIRDKCEDNNIDFSYFCIGIQKHSNTLDLFKTAEKFDVNYVLERDIVDSDDCNVIKMLDSFIKLQQHIYITICSDVFSSFFAPGVSAPQPLGLNPERVLKFLKYILRCNKTMSFDICEVSPKFDQDDTTSNLASVLIYTVVNTLCEIKNLSI